MQCTNCKSEILANVKFCPECGNKVENQGKTCPNLECNRTGLPEEALFCSDCGFQFEKNQLKHYNNFVKNNSIQYSFSHLDNFSTKGKTWNDYSDNEEIFKHESGYLKAFSLKAGVTCWRFHEIDGLKGCRYFEISVDVKKIHGSDDRQFGVLFSSEKGTQVNVFGVTGNSHFYIGEFNNGKWDGKFEPDKENVKKSGHWNNLKVIFDGKIYNYFVNNFMVYQHKAEFFGNYIGIQYSGSVTELWFDDLIVNVLY